MKDTEWSLHPVTLSETMPETICQYIWDRDPHWIPFRTAGNSHDPSAMAAAYRFRMDLTRLELALTIAYPSAMSRFGLFLAVLLRAKKARTDWEFDMHMRLLFQRIMRLQEIRRGRRRPVTFDHNDGGSR
jgi:hypothetical protein